MKTKRITALIGSFLRREGRAPNKAERETLEQQAKAAHGSIYGTVWPALRVRRIPERVEIGAYERDLRARVNGPEFRDLGVDKVSARLGVSRRTVRRLRGAVVGDVAVVGR